MNYPERTPPSPGADLSLTDELFVKGHAFGFFQAVRLLKMRLRRDPGARGPDVRDPDDISGDRLRMRPKLSLAFPPADIDCIRKMGNRSMDSGETKSGAIDGRKSDPANHPAYEISAHFLGLYGVSSPLPSFYTEDLMHEAADDETACRDFLDIFNQRIFELFYDCCGKYRQVFQVVEANSRQHMERLFCLMGIGDASLRNDIADPRQLIRYIGLLIQKPRSAMGLETLLKDALEGVPVSVVPCVKRSAKIPGDQQFRLGSTDHGLGENTIVGEEITDRMGKFAIRIGPLASGLFADFNPDAEKFETLRFLTDFFIPERLAYDIEVILSEGEAQTVCLGHPDQSRVGLNTWIFSGGGIGEVRKVYPSGG